MSFPHLAYTPSLTTLTSLSALIDNLVGVMIERSRAHQAIDSTAIIREKLSEFLSKSQKDASLSAAERDDLVKILSPEKDAILWLYKEMLPRLIAALDTTQPAHGSSIPESGGQNGEVEGKWEEDGVSFPAGTRLRFTYKGFTTSGVLLPGKRIRVENDKHSTPYTSISAAANAIADGVNATLADQQRKNGLPVDEVKPASLNGWTYWSVLVGDKWIKLSEIRLSDRLSERAKRAKIGLLEIEKHNSEQGETQDGDAAR